jgi:hypothetical protein
MVSDWLRSIKGVAKVEPVELDGESEKGGIEEFAYEEYVGAEEGASRPE